MLSLESTTAEIEAYTSTIAATEDRLLHEENDLEAAHSAWQIAKEKMEAKRKQAEIARKQAKLAAKKARLVKKIGKPKYVPEVLYDYIPCEAIVEDRLLNQCFLDMLSNQNEASRIAAYQLFVEEHSKELEQIRELNRILECAENDGIEAFIAQDGSKPTEVHLPERFIALNAYFGKVGSWKHLRHAAKKTQKGKSTKIGVQEQLFEGVDYLKFSGIKNTALLFS